MIVRKELKAKAKKQIKGNIGILLGISLLCGLILAPVITMILMPAFLLSFATIYLRMTDFQKPKVGDLFAGFKSFGKALWLFIVMMFFISLWSLLLVVPGIIKAYSYSQAFFILADNPNMTALEALRESKKIMSGNKWKLFVLELSFIWWILLGSVTFGIAYIWVGPYMYATFANFYLAISSKPATEVKFEKPEPAPVSAPTKAEAKPAAVAEPAPVVEEAVEVAETAPEVVEVEESIEE